MNETVARRQRRRCWGTTDNELLSQRRELPLNEVRIVNR